jgi:hypothetical protein
MAQAETTDASMPDKNRLYGVFERSAKWRDDLHRKATHKALDIADEMDFNQTLTRTGMTWKELAVIAAMLLGGGALGMHYFASERQAPPVDSEYEVRFYDKDGNPIHVPHVSRRR